MQSHWHPTAILSHLRFRAAILEKIRAFFKARNVVEVETPLLCSAGATDPHIQSFTTLFTQPGSNDQRLLYLQTSPEFAMKRLLAAGIGPIYQICKAFRNEEKGRLHNPEFTILEWYRPKFNHHDLMDEVDLFLKSILNIGSAERLSYEEVFWTYLKINPHQASTLELQKYAKKHGLTLKNTDLSRDDWLQLLMMHFIEPQLNKERPIFIYDFPASQAALSKIRDGKIPVAERFEVYVRGLEIANGYHELCDAKEQRKRFKKDQIKRQLLKQAEVPIDNYLIAALEHGLPHCAGIALGIDRLVMLALMQDSIADVITFPIERA